MHVVKRVFDSNHLHLSVDIWQYFGNCTLMQVKSQGDRDVRSSMCTVLPAQLHSKAEQASIRLRTLGCYVNLRGEQRY